MTAAATSECVPKRMDASPGNGFEKIQVKSYYKSPRRTAPICSTPGGRHGPAEIDGLARSRTQGAVAARGIQELRPEGQRHRSRGRRDHRRRVRQDRGFAGEAYPYAFRGAAAAGGPGLPRMEDRGRGE